jgi:hypothetical protein
MAILVRMSRLLEGLFGRLALMVIATTLALGASRISPAQEEDDDDVPRREGRPDGRGSGREKEGPTKPAKPLSIEEEYVRENLQGFLHPTQMDFLDDGRVKLTFELGAKKTEHETIFTPNVSNDVKNKFRWTVRGEYGYWGTGRRTAADDDGYYYYNGIRIAMDGAAHLNAWFTDDVEAEIYYIQATTHNPKQTAALVYTGKGGRSIGSNFGSQCMHFASGRPSKAQGTVDQVVNEKLVKIKLVVRNGTFEAHRDGRQKETAEYLKKNFESGRIGLIWGGGLASFVNRIDIVGHLDYKQMYEMMRKTKKR